MEEPEALNRRAAERRLLPLSSELPGD